MEAILDQLSGLRETLQADGYDLRVDSLREGQLQLSVVALDQACEECLVPRDIMRRAIAASLSDPTITAIELRYPGEEPA